MVGVLLEEENILGLAPILVTETEEKIGEKTDVVTLDLLLQEAVLTEIKEREDLTAAHPGILSAEEGKILLKVRML